MGKRKEEEIKKLENENEDLSKIINKQINKTKEQTDLKDGALNEVDKLNKRLLEEMEKNISFEPEVMTEPEIEETAKILDSAENQLVKHENNLQKMKKEIDQLEHPNR